MALVGRRAAAFGHRPCCDSVDAEKLPPAPTEPPGLQPKVELGILAKRPVKPGKNALPIVFAVRMPGVMADEIFLHA